MTGLNSQPTGAPGDREGMLRKLIEVGISLSAERDHERLFESILIEAMKFCNADGGTLYLRSEEASLSFAIMRNGTLGIARGGTTGAMTDMPEIPLFDDNGTENHGNVASHVALTGITSAIADAYETGEFDFTGTKEFDERTGYRSKSFLTLPMKNSEDDVIGVLQLINARDSNGEIIAFPEEIQPLAEALASQAAVALDNDNLLRGQRELLESFIRLIAAAIDAKSPYTGGHCQRVPVLTEMLAEAACLSQDEAFKDFDLSDEEYYELHIAAWLHDCGKVTTPEYVVDKATKLETLCDRIEGVRTRLEVLKRDAEIAYLKACAEPGADRAACEAAYREALAQFDDDRRFLESVNIGDEFMAEEDQARVAAIAAYRWRNWDGVESAFLSDDEVENLCISRGTLNGKERTIINNHIDMTIEMLEKLPFPKYLSRVPEYAGGHHEKMDGSGYPRGLKRDDMSLPARMMAIADVFEALTARDRPYKKAKTVGQSVAIMARMEADDHIDPDLWRLFLQAGIHTRYGERFLEPEQNDAVDVRQVLSRSLA